MGATASGFEWGRRSGGSARGRGVCPLRVRIESRFEGGGLSPSRQGSVPFVPPGAKEKPLHEWSGWLVDCDRWLDDDPFINIKMKTFDRRARVKHAFALRKLNEHGATVHLGQQRG